MQIINLLNNITESPTIQDTDHLLKKILSDLGHEKFTYNYYSLDFQKTKKAKHVLCTESVKGWQEHYVNQNYDLIDPILKRMHETNLPFGWKLEEELAKYGQDQKCLFRDAIDFGLHGGFAVPIHAPCGAFANLVIQDVGILDKLTKEPYLKHSLHLIANYYHNRISNLISLSSKAGSIHLTPRETECLYLTRQNKSAKEIARILNITPRTISFHIENALKKFNAKNKYEAVSMAIQLGLFL